MSLAPIRGTGAIRVGIGLLGAIGFALSYDALRQMAVAVHIRGFLTYAFPLVIDGFIAIGIGALLILRTGPVYARVYVWTLVGLATATSIWANALHAIRLNEQDRHEPGLRLDDVTVGALSAIAPLALAGAVHLYLVIRRHPADRHNQPRHNGPEQTAPEAAVRHLGCTHERPAPPADGVPKPMPEDEGVVAEGANEAAETATPPGSGRARGRRAGASMDELLALGRTAERGRSGRVSRRNVEAAIRAAGHTIGKDRLTEATRLLQDEADRHQAERTLADA